MKDPNTQQKNSYKISVCFFIVFILVSFSLPQKTNAQFVPTFDLQVFGVETERAAIDTSLWSKEYVADLVAYAAASVAIEQISIQLQNMILDAANSFVRDLEQELINLENSVGNQLGIDINAVATCFPDLDFSPVPNSAWNKFKFQASVSCTNSSGPEMSGFYSNGGFNWDTYDKMAFAPQKYNPFGRNMAVQKELNKRTAEAKERELEQLNWGRGLRAARDSLTGLIKTPAAAIQNQLDEAFSMSQQRMQNADELTEILVAVVSSVVSNAISENVEF